jgi:hypothetical protein
MTNGPPLVLSAVFRLERDRNLVARFERAPSRSAVQERTAVLLVLFASPKLPLWAVRAGERPLHP